MLLGVKCRSFRTLPVHARSVIHIQSAIPRPNFPQIVTGEKFTDKWRLFLGKTPDTPISPWHDIPLVAGHSEEGTKIFNFVVEIPRGESHKLEMSKEEQYNPIKHDLANGQIRQIKYHPFVWNYGFFPQTFEDPQVVCEKTGLPGDGDPLDVVDVGLFSPHAGSVVHVKVIGALGLIDQGETDWKIITINISDPKAYNINGPEDLLIHKKGVTETLRDFWINYKTADGKPKNKLALDGKLLSQAETYQLIEAYHKSYEQNRPKFK